MVKDAVMARVGTLRCAVARTARWLRGFAEALVMVILPLELQVLG
jgi:hypothetical protein